MQMWRNLPDSELSFLREAESEVQRYKKELLHQDIHRNINPNKRISLAALAVYFTVVDPANSSTQHPVSAVLETRQLYLRTDDVYPAKMRGCQVEFVRQKTSHIFFLNLVANGLPSLSSYLECLLIFSDYNLSLTRNYCVNNNVCVPSGLGGNFGLAQEKNKEQAQQTKQVH